MQNKGNDLQRLDQDSLDRFRELFHGRTDWYGHRDFRTNKCWTEGERGNDGQLLKDENDNNYPPIPLVDEHFHRHFNNVQGLGVIPIQQNGNTYFGSLDIDKDDIDHVDLVNRISQLGLPLYVFVSRSLAAHAIFFIGGEGMPATVVKKRLEQWALAIGCGKDLIAAEVFPKQHELDEPGAVGNFINLPFFQEFLEDVEADDHRGQYVTPDGRFVGIAEFLATAEQHDPKMSMPIPIRTVAFSDGPPCLETLQQKGMPEGTRNNGLYNVGVYFKKSNPEEWQDLLQAYNNKFMIPPFHTSKMDQKEMKSLIRSLKRKEYQYKCGEDPISSQCEKGLCKTRMYGIKTAEELLRDKVNKIECPVTAIIKYESDPVTWGLVLNEGKATVNVAGGELLMYVALRRYFLDALGEVPPSMKAEEWDLKLNDLLKQQTIVEVSEESGENKLILTLLEQFVRSGRQEEALIESMVCVLFPKAEKGVNGSLACFTTKSFREFLLGMKVKFEVNRLSVTLKQCGWDNTTKRIAGHVKRVWSKFQPGLIPREDADGNMEGTIDEDVSGAIAEGVPGEEPDVAE